MPSPGFVESKRSVTSESGSLLSARVKLACAPSSFVARLASVRVKPAVSSSTLVNRTGAAITPA